MKKKNSYYSDTSVYNEAIKTLRTNIQYSDIDHSLKKLIVTSSVPNEGKTTIAIELAKSFAQNGFKVLLIDCDLRNSSVGKYMKYNNNVGLTNVLHGNMKLTEAIVVDEKEENFHILFSGPKPPNPAEVVSSKLMENLLEGLEETYDYVLIDTPPVGFFTDAAILSTKCDGVIIVTRSNSTKVEELNKAVENIRAVGSKIVGIVLSFAKTKSSHYGEYYR